MSKRLIDEVKRNGGVLGTNESAKLAVEAVTNAIEAVTGQGEPVKIRGFGTFQRKTRSERVGRNPRTGEKIRIAAREQLTFTPRKDA